MKKLALLLVVLAVAVVAVFLATCGGEDDASVVAPSEAPRAKNETARPRQRSRGQEPRTDGATETTERAAPSGPTTEFVPDGTKVATARHVLRGRVVNSRKSPVAGARVNLYSCWLTSDVATRFEEKVRDLLPHAASETKTGDDGSFELPYWDGGPRGLSVTHDGNTRAFRAGVDDATELEIVLADEEPTLLVRVTDPEGKPAGDADVAVHQSPLPDLSWVVSPESVQSGFVTVSSGVKRFVGMVAGPAVVLVKRPGFAHVFDRRIVVPDTGETVLDVKLEPGVAVRGRVIDAGTGAPVPSVWVRFGDLWHPDSDANTDADGRFAFEDLPRSLGTFTLTKDGYGETRFVAGNLPEGATTFETELRMEAAANVTLRCLDKSKRPAANVLVVVHSHYDAPVPGGTRPVDDAESVALTDADGRAKLPGLHPGATGRDLRVRFYVDGVPVLERKFPALAPSETRDLGDIELR